jgi:hypothetical protein
VGSNPTSTAINGLRTSIPHLTAAGLGKGTTGSVKTAKAKSLT